MRTCGFDWGEEREPVLHDGDERLDPDLRRARHEPAHHVAPPPVERRQRHTHHLSNGTKRFISNSVPPSSLAAFCQTHNFPYLESELERCVQQRHVSRIFCGRCDFEGVLRELEELRRAVYVAFP